MKKIFFIHIPKTGGVTIERMLARITDSIACPAYEEQGFFEHQNENYGLYHGHLMYFFKEFIKPDFAFTLLRDPIERAMSAFEHIRRDPAHVAHSEIIGTPDVVSALHNPAIRVHLSNAMSLYLGLRPEFGLFPDPMTAVKDAWDTRSPEALLENAKKAVLDLDFIGFTERLHVNQRQLHDLLGQSPTEKFRVISENVNPEKTSLTYRERLSRDDLDALMEANEEDIDLYHFARSIAVKRGWFKTPSELMRPDVSNTSRDLQPTPAERKFGLDQLIEGEGWHSLERRGDLNWRFTGPGDVATLYLSGILATAKTVIVEVVHAVTLEHFRQLQVRWNGLELGPGRYSGMRVFFSVPEEVQRLRRTRVDIITPPAQIPEFGDNRKIGVAISSIIVSSADIDQLG